MVPTEHRSILRHRFGTGKRRFPDRNDPDWTRVHSGAIIRARMRIALLHYHLRPGGVTTVIRDQYRALADEHDCLVFTGEAPEKSDDRSWDASIRVVPGIGYAGSDGADADPRRTAAAIRDAMAAEWGRAADILHVHNPTLNKNPRMLLCLRILQEEGQRLFAQVHDFAEEGRPRAFYPADEEYPADCHYGVINSRDRGALLSAGLAAHGVHLMFNCVRSPVGVQSGARASARRLLYSVRGIRRKNLGEALLVGLLLDAEVTFTLPPRDPSDLVRFDAWRDFTKKSGLRARFGAGHTMTLPELIMESRAAITTSVGEGFGFSFLEPWTAGIAVVGRRVSHVCRDFEEEGIRLPQVYPSLPVRLDLFDAPSLAQRWRRSVHESFSGFGREMDGESISAAWSEIVNGGSIDFSFLDEDAQRQVITRVVSDASARKSVEKGITCLESIRQAMDRPDDALLEANRSIVQASYGPRAYAALMRHVYRAVLDVEVKHSVDRNRLLDHFLKPERLRMVESR